MKSSIFKFYNFNAAKFVSEELSRMGHTTRLLSSGFISVDTPIDESAARLIAEQKGAVVVSGPTVTPAVSKMMGSAGMVDRRKLPPPTEDPKSPPTFNGKSVSKPKVTEETETDKKKDSAKSSESLKGFALETLKKLVEKNPNRFPKLAKMFGIETKK